MDSGGARERQPSYIWSVVIAEVRYIGHGPCRKPDHSHAGLPTQEPTPHNRQQQPRPKSKYESRKQGDEAEDDDIKDPLAYDIKDPPPPPLIPSQSSTLCLSPPVAASKAP